MDIEITKPISRERWLEALGYGREAARASGEARLARDLDKAERLITDAARPKAVYRVMRREDVRTEGVSLERHLDGCDSVIVMALTLGMGVDNMIKRTQVTDMALAVIMDAGASVLTDSLCDEFEIYIGENTDGYITSRFGIGYGDSPLSLQRDIVAYVDGQRSIGLNVTAGDLLLPRKSVTALIGLSDVPVKGRLARCEECVLRDKCELRKEGRFCGDRF